MKALEILCQLETDLGAEVYLVGGAVRDLVIGKVPSDLDILVRNIDVDQLEKFLRSRGTLALVGQLFGVYLFRAGEERAIEIALPRTESSTGEGHKNFNIVTDPTLSLEEDASRRDFTCNAMYLPIKKFVSGSAINTQDVLDFNDGLLHIKEKLIVAVGNPKDRLQEDPLRMLRAMVLIAKTGFRLEGRLFSDIKYRASSIKTVSPERIGSELQKMLSSDKPSRALKAMHRTGLLEIVLPEVAACVGCGQNPKHHSYPVFEHIIYATDAACTLTNRLDVRFAALCHDLGKATTREVRPGGLGADDVSFHNHEIASTHLTYALLKRLKFSTSFIEAVVHLVRYHQYKYERTWTDKAVRKFIRNCGITREQLTHLDNHPQFLVRQADRMGNALKAQLPITPKQLDFQTRIVKVYNESSAQSLHDLAINGKDIMEALSLSPTPLIGKILRHLFESVDQDPTKNVRNTLLDAAKVFIDNLSETEIEALEQQGTINNINVTSAEVTVASEQKIKDKD